MGNCTRRNSQSKTKIKKNKETYLSMRSNVPEKTEDYDYYFKILIIGDAGVGKSSFLLRFSDNTFTESRINTLGVDFKVRTLNINGSRVKMQIWDTAGQERFSSITITYYRAVQGIIILYDITNRETFTNVNKWVLQINKYACDCAKIVLVGNKSDMVNDRKVTSKEAEQLAGELNFGFLETSAKNALNVEEGFIKLAIAIKEKLEGP